jgi:hypothetical protein
MLDAMAWQVVETPTGRVTARYPGWAWCALPVIRGAMKRANRWNAEEDHTERYVLERV